MISKNYTYQKITSFILVISILMPAVIFFSTPKKAEAQFDGPVIIAALAPLLSAIAASTAVSAGANTTLTVKTIAIEILKQMLMAVVRKLLNQMTQNTINWINSGFHGNPLYLERPDSFFKDIAKYEVKNLVDLFGYDQLKYPFGKDFGLNIINSYQRQLADNAAYSLSNAIKDPVYLDSFRNDFNVGGWNGFLINTQYPQNNYLGFNMLATEELARKLQGTTQNAAQKVQTTLQQGAGFLSPQTCPSNPKYNNTKNEFLQPRWNEADYIETQPYENQYTCSSLGPPESGKIDDCTKYTEYLNEWTAFRDSAKGEWTKDNTCPGGLVATTPGSIVGSQIGTALGSKIHQAELGAAIGNSLSAIFDALINKFLDKGLSALTNTNYQGEGNGVFDTSSPEAQAAGQGFMGATNTTADTYAGTIAEGNYTGEFAGVVNGQCDETGYQYAEALGDAEDAVLAANPLVADLPNIESGGRPNARTFLSLVEAELISKGFNATVDVKNGHSNPSTGDIIGIWKEGDTMMERYDAIIGAAKTIREAATVSFAGFIPLDCTASGGGKDCGCKSAETPPTETPPEPGAVCNTCAEKGQTDKYQTDVRNAASEYLATHPEIANLDSYDDSNGGVAKLRDGVISILKSKGFNATTSGNPPYAQVVNVWKTGDPDVTGYRVAAGGGPISQAIPAGYCGGHETFAGVDIIPNSCQATTPPSPGSRSTITSISPMTATAGSTTITITGSNLTNQVSFYDGSGGRNTVVGTVNSAKTQTTVLVPAGLPKGNATVKVYEGNQIWSNGVLIAISDTEGGATTATSFDATGGWGGNLAYNPAQNNWLVVSGGVNGRIMGNDGTPVTAEFTIQQTSSSVQVMAPKVAFASDINKYLVIWIGFPDPVGGTIYGRFVNTDGSFGGNAFTIFKDPADGGSILYSNSTLQYDSKNKKFVFVWDYRHPKADVNLITISQSGIPGTAVKVGDDSNGESWVPSLAINENSNEYCVAYDKRNSGNKVAAVRKYNAVTGVLGTETILNTAGMYTSIVYNSVNNKYLIGWNSGSSLTSQAKILNSCNITDGGSIFTSNSAGQTQTLSYNPKSNNYASIVQNQNDAGNTYNIFNSIGTKLSSGVAFTGGNGNFAPVISANTSDGTFAATSSKEYAMTRFAPSLGTATASSASTPKYIDLGGGAFPDVTWYNSRLYVAYRSANNLAINLYSFDKNLADQKTEKIFTLSAGAGGFPRLTVNNGTLWVAFRDGEASGEDIKLWRQDTGAIESLGGGVGNDPVALGYGYIAWQKCEGTLCATSKVYRRLLTGGTSTFIRNWLPTGISRILSNGSVVMIDTDRTAISWGLNAWFAGKLGVGTDITPYDDNGIAARFSSLVSSEFNLWLGQRAHTPHAATDGLGNYAVATWNPTVRVSTFTGPQ